MAYPYTVIVAAFPVVGGLLLAGYGLVLWLRIQDLRQRGQTSGIVVDNEISSYDGGRLRFRPVVRFQDRVGREFTFVGAQGRNRSYVAGSRLVVVYDPDNPRRAVVGTGGLAVAYLATGLAIAMVGVASYVMLLLQAA